MQLIVLAVAVFPAVALCIYIYQKDRGEKEPLSLLLKLMALGAASCFPAAYVERALNTPMYNVFNQWMVYDFATGSTQFTGTMPMIVYNIVECFLCVALVEELSKWLILYFATKRNRNFNSMFDGVIYSVFVSLGFAVLENIFYAFSFGLSTALLRAVTSVPAHMFFGVTMGKSYSDWNTHRLCSSLELTLARCRVIDVRHPYSKGEGHLALSLVIPVFLHGLYDFCLSVDSTVLYTVYIALLVFLYVYCFYTVKYQSDSDIAVDRLIVRLLCKKYPEYIPGILYTVNNPQITGVIVPKSGADL